MNPRDEGFDERYAECKSTVKRWEKSFVTENGRIPSKYDIKEASSEVRRAYSRYYHTKARLLEGVLDEASISPPPSPSGSAPRSPSPVVGGPSSLPTVDQIERLVSSQSEVWGEHLNKRKPTVSRRRIESPRNFIKNVSPKLYESWKFNKRNPRKSVPLKAKEHSDSFEDLSQNSDASRSFTTEFDVSRSIGRSESLPVSLGAIDVERFSSTPVNPVNLLSSRSLTVHDIDSNWVERCNSELSSSTENDTETRTIRNDDVSREGDVRTLDRVKTYGLSNIRMDGAVYRESDDDTPDCIENSESDGEQSFSGKRYQRLRPVVKKKKIDSDETIVCSLESGKSSDIGNSTLKTIPEDHKSSTVKNNLKRKSRKVASKSTNKSKGNSKNKKKAKAEFKGNDRDEDTENEVDFLADSNIEMPRFILKSSILKESNIVDGLLKSLELPKKKKLKKDEEFDDRETRREERLREKLNSGTINDNFVRINIEKKVFVRGKKSVNYSKFKKQQWKNKKKKMQNLDMEFPEGGLLKCFKCNELGHLSRYCRAHKGNNLLPLKDLDEVSHKTLQEAENPGSEKEEKIVKELFSFQNVIDKSRIWEKDALADVGNSDKKMEFVPESFLRLCEKTIDNEFVPHTVNSLYQLNSDGTLIATPQEVRDALHLFGYSDFRDGQECAIMRILSGLSTLLTLSTGSGKSLCYQLPAYLYSKYNKCITIVISPLVSLMEDQVLNMPRFLRAACLHTNQTSTQRQKIIELIKNNEIDVLLISPEAVVSSERSSGFSGILRHLPPIAFACIDEVHCVSQWSHNFRPSYLMICRVLKEKLQINCLLGLTATATVITTKSVMHHLGISDGLHGVISNIPIPNNLILTVSKDSNKDRAVMELLLSERFKNFNSIIVYCIRRDECERVAALIRTSLSDVTNNSSTNLKTNRKRKRCNWFVDTYHAGMSASKRHKVQEAFMNGDLKIVVATVAFGMGINKADIRGVIHYNMPNSFESYVQEVGRAGRDGLIAHCHTFIGDRNKDQNELLRHIHANTIERHIIRKLLQKIFIPCSCKTIKSNIETFEIQNICSGHEVAFSIEETVRELDIPAENISTLLCYLELTSDKYIKVLSNVYTVCKIISYGGSIVLLDMAQKSPPLAMAIALEKNKGKSFDNVGTFEFCVIDVAAALGWKSGLVKYHLKNLEWDKSNDKIKKSPLRVEFHTLGFRVLAPGDLTASQLDAALDSLFERTQSQEKAKLNQLYWVSKSLLDVSHVSISECSYFETESTAFKNSEKLKSDIQNYFSHESLPNITTDEEIILDYSQLIADIRGLITTYHDCTFTAKAIARILQGISSPNFPAIVWGKCKYWRRHIAVNFYKILEIAKQQILLLK